MLKVAWSPLYAHPLPSEHRFPMEKYELLPQQLQYEGTLNAAHFFLPKLPSTQQLHYAHSPDWIRKLRNQALSPSEIRKTGFPFSKQLVQREEVIMGGTIQAALFALEFGIGMNIAGGTHHAFTDSGEGFCLLNDIAIAARVLQREKNIKSILIVDLDVHQGNGTASIFKNDPSVFTFSMHGEKNYPFHKEQSSLDIGLPDGIKDASYLDLLQNALAQILSLFKPDFIFYQSGVDVLFTDKLGKLQLSLEGVKARDWMVFETAKSLGVPICCSMGGGYSADIRIIVEAHANTFRLAQHFINSF